MADEVTLGEALALLGLAPSTTDPAVVRAAYLAAIRQAHPDVNEAANATTASARLKITSASFQLDGCCDTRPCEFHRRNQPCGVTPTKT